MGRTNKDMEMPVNDTVSKWVTLPLRKRLTRFAREDDGLVTILALFMIMMMIAVGGIQLDFMRHEMERSRLQAVSDRAVLAAADLDQMRDPKTVVEDYFAKSGMTEFLSNVVVDDGLNFRTVTVDASKDMDTQFIGRFGFPTLEVPAHSQAEERVAKVEISLVLDISGSMATNNRLGEVQNAADIFLDTVLKDENQDLISVSLVPYSEQVNAGPLIMDRMNVNRKHDYSHCIDFDNGDFDSIAMNSSTRYNQMQHFQWNYDGRNNYRDDTVCPRYDYERITPFSQNKRTLKNQIDDLVPRAGTSIFLGMKWAAAMLDPAFRDINNSLVNAGYVDREFYNRPASYTDSETLKTVILMTDGANDNSYRIRSNYYDSDSEYVHWNKYNLWWYLRREVDSRYWGYFYYHKYNKTLGNTLLSNICDAAKAKRIVIWSIGFEVDDEDVPAMQDCASSPSHFFRVEGVELSEAFRAIARQINQLRLTQ
ncbi:hypothetical protein IT972_11660 [Sulfitobacter sp. B30-2]|jgi:Flp pilus assembly protein TadG|nr:TadE/TadG family type IV pilus assembly protein [Sulfitobacter pontiacus]QPO08188.1 hypothetical protein IT972_11660 [Sulfitobacter sp. B30-2]